MSVSGRRRLCSRPEADIGPLVRAPRSLIRRELDLLGKNRNRTTANGEGTPPCRGVPPSAMPRFQSADLLHDLRLAVDEVVRHHDIVRPLVIGSRSHVAGGDPHAGDPRVFERDAEEREARIAG